MRTAAPSSIVVESRSDERRGIRVEFPASAEMLVCSTLTASRPLFREQEIFDEPESALHLARQVLFLRLLGAWSSMACQVIMATHAPDA